MIDQTLNILNEIFNLKGVRRGLWVVILLLTISIVFESRTQFFSTQSIETRVDVLAKLSEVSSQPDADLPIHKLKTSMLKELSEIQEKLENPTGALVDIFSRFLAGSWVVFLLFPPLLKIYKKAFFSMKENLKDPMEYSWLAFWGMRGLSIVAWLGTFLGLISVLWNSSDNFFVSWVLFPAGSLLSFSAIFLWVALMKVLLPFNKKDTKG